MSDNDKLITVDKTSKSMRCRIFHCFVVFFIIICIFKSWQKQKVLLTCFSMGAIMNLNSILHICFNNFTFPCLSLLLYLARTSTMKFETINATATLRIHLLLYFICYFHVFNYNLTIFFVKICFKIKN